MARVAMERAERRLSSPPPISCPRPPVIRGRLRLVQMQSVVFIYAAALVAALSVAGLECALSLVVSRVYARCQFELERL